MCDIMSISFSSCILLLPRHNRWVFTLTPHDTHIISCFLLITFNNLTNHATFLDFLLGTPPPLDDSVAVSVLHQLWSLTACLPVNPCNWLFVSHVSHNFSGLIRSQWGTNDLEIFLSKCSFCCWPSRCMWWWESQELPWLAVFWWSLFWNMEETPSLVLKVN